MLRTAPVAAALLLASCQMPLRSEPALIDTPPELIVALEKRFPGLKFERSDGIGCYRGRCSIVFDIGNQTVYRHMVCQFRSPAKLGRCRQIHA
jgi:hypothetical protein